MFQKSLVRDEHVEPLAQAACRVLADVGVMCQNAELLRALEQAGAKVDHAAERAWFPVPMVREFVDGLHAAGDQDVELSLYGAAGAGGADAATEGAPCERARFRSPAMPALELQVAQFYYDHARGERRAGNREDLITLIKLADVLHPESPAGHALVQTEFPAKLEALETALVIAEYAHNPGPAFAWYADQVDYLREMGEVLGQENWFSWGAICFAHPLRFDRDVAEKLVRRAREGVPTGPTAMPIAGFTTPVTVEGFIAVSCAEIVATWMAARAINPEVPFDGSMWAGTIDMATGTVSYCAFDAMYYAFAATEFLQRWTGIRLPVGGGEYCDAREPGLYAAMEKAYKAMTIAAFTGEHPQIGQGMLEEGKTLSPVQLMLERDLGLGLFQFGRELDPGTENISLSSIRDVDLGLERNHLISDHTLAHFRDTMWLPKCVDRSGWTGAAGDQAMLDKAQAGVDALLAQYEKPAGRENQLQAMRRIADRAREQLT